MKTKDLRILFVLMISSVSMTGGACTSNHVNLLKNGTIKLERIPSKAYYISHVDVYQNDDELVVKGNVKRRSRVGTGSGHVDIAIVSPDGEIIEQISTPYKPRIILTKNMYNRKSHFKVLLPTIPPTGSEVRVAYHRISKGDRNIFSCGQNRAALEGGL